MATDTVEAADHALSTSVRDVAASECDIVLITGQLSIGGSERQLLLLTEGLVDRGIRVAVAVSHSRDVEPILEPIQRLAQVVRLDSGLSHRNKLQRAVRLRSFVQRTRPGIVHSTCFRTNWIANFAARGTRAIDIGSVRSDFTRCKYDYGFILGAINCRWPRRQVFNSISAATKARQSKSFFSPRVVDFVRNAVRTSREQLNPETRSDGVIRIVGVGRLTDSKRWDCLIRLAARLKAPFPHVRVRLVGDGPSRDKLEALVRSHDVGDIFEMHGEVDDVSDLLSSSDLLVHPSALEGSPNVIMEAMAAGKPVIATDVGDTSQLVVNGETGFVVAEGDEDAIFEKTCQLMEEPQLLRQLGRSGREIAIREFSVDRLVDSMLQIYRSAGWTSSDS